MAYRLEQHALGDQEVHSCYTAMDIQERYEHLVIVRPLDAQHPIKDHWRTVMDSAVANGPPKSLPKSLPTGEPTGEPTDEPSAAAATPAGPTQVFLHMVSPTFEFHNITANGAIRVPQAFRVVPTPSKCFWLSAENVLLHNHKKSFFHVIMHTTSDSDNKRP